MTSPVKSDHPATANTSHPVCPVVHRAANCNGHNTA